MKNTLDDPKVAIQEELGDSPEESVEVGHRSEIMQVDQKVLRPKQHLLKIDQIHKNGRIPLNIFICLLFRIMDKLPMLQIFWLS